MQYLKSRILEYINISAVKMQKEIWAKSVKYGT